MHLYECDTFSLDKNPPAASFGSRSSCTCFPARYEVHMWPQHLGEDLGTCDAESCMMRAALASAAEHDKFVLSRP